MITITSDNFTVQNDNKLICDLQFLKTKDSIIIKNSHFVCPQFYFYKAGNNFVLSTEHKLKINGRNIFSPVLDIKHSMWGINGNYQKMLNSKEPELPYKVITNYSQIKITRTGELTVKENDYSELYSINIEDSSDIIDIWIEKYSDLVSDLCKQNKFIPTLTGGCDTRILTYFWRKFDIKNYRLRAVKKDGKNNVQKGQLEIDISKQVLSRLGKNAERLEEPPEGMISMCGTYTESTQYDELLNDKHFVTDVINKCNFEWYQLQPFTDDLYLLIKPSKKYEIRVLFMLLLCPDLLDIDLISDAGRGVYKFDSEFKDVITDCKELISRWRK